MIFYNTNILAGPLFMMIFIIDTYLFLAAAKFVLDCVLSEHHTWRSPMLEKVVDGPVRATEQRLVTLRRRPVPPWLPWLLVLCGAIAIRQALATIVLFL